MQMRFLTQKWHFGFWTKNATEAKQKQLGCHGWLSITPRISLYTLRVKPKELSHHKISNRHLFWCFCQKRNWRQTTSVRPSHIVLFNPPGLPLHSEIGARAALSDPSLVKIRMAEQRRQESSVISSLRKIQSCTDTFLRNEMTSMRQILKNF